MTDPPRYPDTGDDRGAEPGRGPTTATPRWISVVGIIFVILLVLLFVLLHLTGTVGPGGH